MAQVGRSNRLLGTYAGLAQVAEHQICILGCGRSTRSPGTISSRASGLLGLDKSHGIARGS